MQLFKNVSVENATFEKRFDFVSMETEENSSFQKHSDPVSMETGRNTTLLDGFQGNGGKHNFLRTLCLHGNGGKL